MEKKDIRQLKLNPDNPRTMSEFMEGKLIESLLVFPAMLELRPILVNEENIVIGGNQRTACLIAIQKMDMSDIEDYMFNQKKFRISSEEDKTKLLEHWERWKQNPEIPVRVLNSVSAEEEKEILVKDNLHYGEDDMDIMKRYFDRESISDYFGTVPWNFYDYGDKINDQNLDIQQRKFAERFSCGYVECQMTDAEFRGLCAALDHYLETHEGISDGFLTYLLCGK